MSSQESSNKNENETKTVNNNKNEEIVENQQQTTIIIDGDNYDRVKDKIKPKEEEEEGKIVNNIVINSNGTAKEENCKVENKNNENENHSDDEDVKFVLEENNEIVNKVAEKDNMPQENRQVTVTPSLMDKNDDKKSPSLGNNVTTTNKSSLSSSEVVVIDDNNNNSSSINEEKKRKLDNINKSESYLLYDENDNDDDNDNGKVIIPTLSEPRWMEPKLMNVVNNNNHNRCTNFEKNYKCKYGISCQYYHVAPLIKSNSHRQIIQQNESENLTRRITLKDYCIFEKQIFIAAENKVWYTAAYCEPNNCIIHYAQLGTNYVYSEEQSLYWYSNKNDAIQALINVISYYKYIHHALVSSHNNDTTSKKQKSNTTPTKSTIMVSPSSSSSDDNSNKKLKSNNIPSSHDNTSNKKIKTITETTTITNQLIYSMINDENVTEWYKDYSTTLIMNFNALYAYRNFSSIHSRIHKQNLSKSSWGKVILYQGKNKANQQTYLYHISLKIDLKKSDGAIIATKTDDTQKEDVKNNDDDIIKPSGFGGVEIDGKYYYKTQLMVKTVLYFMYLTKLVENGILEDECTLDGKELY